MSHWCNEPERKSLLPLLRQYYGGQCGTGLDLSGKSTKERGETDVFGVNSRTVPALQSSRFGFSLQSNGCHRQ